jgi:hypothetical protein
MSRLSNNNPARFDIRRLARRLYRLCGRLRFGTKSERFFEPLPCHYSAPIVSPFGFLLRKSTPKMTFDFGGAGGGKCAACTISIASSKLKPVSSMMRETL